MDLPGQPAAGPPGAGSGSENIGIEKEDLEAQFNGVLAEKDYYPVLGAKRLTVYGKINGAPFDQNEKWELRLHHIIVSSPLGTKTIDNFGNYVVNDANGNPEILGSISVGGTLDTQGQPKLIDSNRPDLLGLYQNEPGYDRSFAKIYIRWNGTKPLPKDVQIDLKLQAVKGAVLQPDPGHGTATEICEKENVRLPYGIMEMLICRRYEQVKQYLQPTG